VVTGVARPGRTDAAVRRTSARQLKVGRRGRSRLPGWGLEVSASHAGATEVLGPAVADTPNRPAPSLELGHTGFAGRPRSEESGLLTWRSPSVRSATGRDGGQPRLRPMRLIATDPRNLQRRPLSPDPHTRPTRRTSTQSGISGRLTLLADPGSCEDDGRERSPPGPSGRRGCGEPGRRSRRLVPCAPGAADGR
jgi:hypothetical protein